MKPMRTLARILRITSTTFHIIGIGGGLLIHGIVDDSLKRMMLTDLAVTCILIGIIAALLTALCEFLLHQRQPRHTYSRTRIG